MLLYERMHAKHWLLYVNGAEAVSLLGVDYFSVFLD